MFNRKYKSTRDGVFAHQNARQTRSEPRTARIVVITITLLIVGNVALAISTKVPELTRAPGEILPSGQFHQVESAEAGIVTSVKVAEGAHVQKDQVLAVMTSATLDQSMTDIAQERVAALNQLRAQREILSALDIPKSRLNGLDQSRALTTRTDYAEARLEVFRAKQEIQAELVAHMTANVRYLELTHHMKLNQVEARKEPLTRQLMLLERGLTTQRDVETAREKADQAEAGVLEIEMRLAQARQDLWLSETTLFNNELVFREELVEVIFDLEQQIVALDARMDALNVRQGNLKIRASEAGILQDVAFPSPGEVIAPGETLFEILPVNQSLVAQIEVDPIDIGHIEQGDLVTLRIDTFDARRYGQITGKISTISPNSVMDEASGNEFFRTTVLLDRETIGSGKWTRNLQPGMAASAEIVTDERSVMAYLIKPISRSLQKAFGER